jgi:Ca2+-binding EF-hand superfamily protein
MAEKKGSAEEIARLTKVFHDIDKDNNGYIDISELEDAFSTAFKASGRPVDAAEVKRACQNIMKGIDRNKDNKITLDEYVQYYTQSSLF